MKKIREILVKDVITASIDDSISSILGKAKEYRIHQIPIIKEGEFIGMIFIKDIVIKDLDAEKTKAKALVVSNIPKLDANMTIEEAARKIIQSGIRALPVFENNKMIGIISEVDLIEDVIIEKNKGDVKLEEIMTTPICLEEKSTLGKVKNVMRENNISRVPIVDADYKLIGVVDTIDIISLIIPKESQRKSREGVGEKIRTRDFPISIAIRKTFTADKNAKLRDVIKAFKEHEEIVIVENNKPIGIVTPKDILEVALQDIVKEDKVEISNIHVLKDIEKDELKNEIQKIIRKRGENINKIFLYVEKRKKGKGNIYSIRARTLTKYGLIIAKSEGRKIKACAVEIRKRIDREIEKIVGKHKDISKLKKQKI